MLHTISKILVGEVELDVTSPRSELALALKRAEGRDGSPGPTGRVVLSIASQPPNSLLHDGYRWRKYQPARLLDDARAAVRQADGADFLVHASYLFAGVPPGEAAMGDRLRVIADAALEAESLVLAGTVPACVVRLGYLYGPDSRDLRLYRRAFRIGRLYWAGPGDVLQHHLHADDAATALIAAAGQRSAGTIFAAADDTPASFAAVMDHFARMVGNPLPLHLPRFSRPLTRPFIAEEHVQMVAFPSALAAGEPRPRNFEPALPDYRAGLRQVVNSWKQ